MIRPRLHILYLKMIHFLVSLCATPSECLAWSWTIYLLVAYPAPFHDNTSDFLATLHTATSRRSLLTCLQELYYDDKLVPLRRWQAGKQRGYMVVCVAGRRGGMNIHILYVK